MSMGENIATVTTWKDEDIKTIDALLESGWIVVGMVAEPSKGPWISLVRPIGAYSMGDPA